jgi:hypothetical protein
VEILIKIVSYFKTINAEDLFVELNTKLGYEFEFRIFPSCQEFYHFLYYYCVHVFNINFMSGIFIIEAKYQPRSYPQGKKAVGKPLGQESNEYFRENPESLTPQFNCPFSSTLYNGHHNITDFFWRNHALEEDRKEETEECCTETKEIIDTLRSVEGILIDVTYFFDAG